MPVVPGIPDSVTTREETIGSISQLFAWGRGGLLLIFLAFVLVDSLPLQLLNPAWQLRFTNRMTNTSILALL